MDFKKNQLPIPKKDLYCVNCGCNGHFYKDCIDAVSSYGVILLTLDIPDNLKIDLKQFILDSKKEKQINGILINEVADLELFCNFKNRIKFLLIRRKHTLGFIEFLRGRYSIDNIEGIIFLFKQMTPEEIKKLATYNFDDFWNEVWGENKNKQSYRNDYIQSKIKFEKLKNDDNGYLSLDFYIENVIPEFEVPEWGFPKGRRNYKELNMECGIREFKEEAGYLDNEFDIINNIPPIEEYFTGTNGVNYKHVYYVGFSSSSKEPIIDPDNCNQANEIGDIGFYTYEECMKIIRPYHIEKQRIVTELYIMMINNLMDVVKGKEEI